LNRRFVIAIAYASPEVADALRAAFRADVDVVDVVNIRTRPWATLDLVLLPAGNEREAETFLEAGCPVVLLANERDDDAEFAAIELGALGYVLWSAPVATLRRMIGAALTGQPVFHRRVLGRWLRAQRRELAEPSVTENSMLTPRQLQILLMVAEGATTKEIAASFRIAKSTVDKHISHLLKRMGVPNRAAAVALLRMSRERRGSAA
jgi:DNA-binding NarL/FixJ family response regulator